jgi:hypothetical protein
MINKYLIIYSIIKLNFKMKNRNLPNMVFKFDMFFITMYIYMNVGKFTMVFFYNPILFANYVLFFRFISIKYHFLKTFIITLYL